jgi:putative ABC transport system ATP-binding protein
MKHITKSFATDNVVTHALREINLDLAEGDFVSVTGPSGSGKTTFLNIAGLLESATAGEYWLDGEDISKLDDKGRSRMRNQKIGFIFQSFNLVPVMTVAENVDYPLFLTGVPLEERRERVAAQLKAVGLHEHAEHLPDALSGGQRQRVAIARALIKRPSLVIADEPTASLDSHTADQVLDLMRERGHAEGAAFVIASHDDRLTRRSDRILSLLDGRLQ